MTKTRKHYPSRRIRTNRTRHRSRGGEGKESRFQKLINMFTRKKPLSEEKPLNEETLVKLRREGKKINREKFKISKQNRKDLEEKFKTNEEEDNAEKLRKKKDSRAHIVDDEEHEAYLSDFIKCKDRNLIDRYSKQSLCKSISSNYSNTGSEYLLSNQLHKKLMNEIKYRLQLIINKEKKNPKMLTRLANFVKGKDNRLLDKAIGDFYVQTGEPKPVQYIIDKTDKKYKDRAPPSSKFSIFSPAELYLSKADLVELRNIVSQKQISPPSLPPPSYPSTEDRSISSLDASRGSQPLSTPPDEIISENYKYVRKSPSKPSKQEEFRLSPPVKTPEPSKQEEFPPESYSDYWYNVNQGQRLSPPVLAPREATIPTPPRSATPSP